MRSLYGHHCSLCCLLVSLLAGPVAASASQLVVTWTDNSSNETGFSIERSNNGTNFAAVGTVGANITSYTDSTVAASTTYWYRVCAFNATSTSAYSNVTSLTTPADPTPVVTTVPGRLANLSVSSVPGQGGPQSLTMGLSISGGSKSVLLRGVGPGLAPYTTLKTFVDPTLTLSNGSTTVASNDNWGGSTLLSTVFTQVGAFPLPTTSKDAVILTALAATSYTTVIGGKVGGIAMSEIYDADSATIPTGTFTRLTGRGPVGTGAAVLTAGFVIRGTTSLHVLIRAIGPSLGTKGALADPQLDLYSGSTLLQHNDNWGGTATLSKDFTATGASSLSATSKDSAIDATLAPGTYSAIVSGVNSTTGVAQIELYAVP